MEEKQRKAVDRPISNAGKTNDLYNSHVMETAKGVTKRILLSKYERGQKISDKEVDRAVEMLPGNKQPIDGYRINESVFVLIFQDEGIRNTALVGLKRSLSQEKSEIKARAYLTKLQQTNKQQIYQKYHKTEGIKVADLGTRVMLIANEDTSS